VGSGTGLDAVEREIPVATDGNRSQVPRAAILTALVRFNLEHRRTGNVPRASDTRTQASVMIPCAGRQLRLRPETLLHLQ
jgi:hypothetical protein